MKKENRFQNSKQIYAWLKAYYHVPQSVINQIRNALAEDAMCDGEGLAYNRIYTFVALALYRRWGFDQQKIQETLQEIDKMADDVNCGRVSFPDLMNELSNDTGIVIRYDREGVIGEYFEEDEVDAN